MPRLLNTLPLATWSPRPVNEDTGFGLQLSGGS